MWPGSVCSSAVNHLQHYHFRSCLIAGCGQHTGGQAWDNSFHRASSVWARLPLTRLRLIFRYSSGCHFTHYDLRLNFKHNKAHPNTACFAAPFVSKKHLWRCWYSDALQQDLWRSHVADQKALSEAAWVGYWEYSEQRLGSLHGMAIEVLAAFQSEVSELYRLHEVLCLTLCAYWCIFL